MTGALLEVQDLSVRRRLPTGPLTLVDRVSFTLHAGAATCLVGESGCGKSLTALALLRLLDAGAGLLAEGSVRFRGMDLLQIPDARLRAIRGGKIGILFQEPGSSLNPVLRVGDQIAEAICLHRNLSRRERSHEVRKLLAEAQVPLPERVAQSYPHELSGGLKQRAALAMALAGEPELLIADEPTTALDVTVQAGILNLLARIQRARGLAILLISHDLGVVARIADRVMVMYAGQIVERASARELFNDPRHPYTQALLSSVPRWDRDQPPIAIAGAVPQPGRWPSGCRFRPRCSKAFDACQRDPAPRALGQERSVACWLEVAIPMAPDQEAART